MSAVLVCKDCGLPITDERLDEAVYYTYDSTTKILEMDLECTGCGSKLYKVAQGEESLWPN